MLAQGFLSVKGQAQITKCYFLWGWRNKYAIIEWPLFDAPTSIHSIFTSFSISQYCCLHLWKNKVGSMLAQGFFKGQKSSKNHKMLLFVSWGNKCVIIEWKPFDTPSSTHAYLLPLVYLGAVAYISVEISLGLWWRRDILRVKGQALFTYCNFLWHCVICNHQVVTTRCAIKYPLCLYFFSLSKYCFLHFCRNKFGLLLARGYFKGQR